jgi:hypothetical protein
MCKVNGPCGNPRCRTTTKTGTYRPRRPLGTGSIRPKGNGWEGRYTDPTGQPRSVYASTREACEARLAEHIAVATGEAPTLTEWAGLKGPRAARPTVATRYQAIALRQLAAVAADVLALPTLPARLRDDLAMTVAAARSALADTGEEAQPA